ncbi:MAG TPA: xanthine dehydrogenase family protein subunit M [Acidimicrobiales bacterium]|nr:xanthine dehydrogenase family protein subunit M [Acidimicrobiales bacterium]
MKPAQFEYHAPTSTLDAVALLKTYAEDAKVIAGGQSLVPMLALRIARFEHLVDLNRIEELTGISLERDELVIKALTRQSSAEHSDLVARHVPLLARAIPKIGHFQIRNRGTVGGSIAHADPASELPCVALCLDATMTLVGPAGSRSVSAADFFVSIWQSTAEVDEIVTEIRFPIAAKSSGFGFEEFALRTGDFAIAGVACAVTLDKAQRIESAAIAFMGMGPTPLRAGLAESALVGRRADEIDCAKIAQQAVKETTPGDDVHASAAYRTQIATSLAGDALHQALQEARDE